MHKTYRPDLETLESRFLLDGRHLVWSPILDPPLFSSKRNWVDLNTGGGRLGVGSPDIGAPGLGTDTDELIFDGAVSVAPCYLTTATNSRVVSAITMLPTYNAPSSGLYIGGNYSVTLEASQDSSFLYGGRIVLGDDYYHTPGSLIIDGNRNVNWGATLLESGDAQSAAGDLFRIQNGALVTLQGSVAFWNSGYIQVSGAGLIVQHCSTWDLSGSDLQIINGGTVSFLQTGCVVNQPTAAGEIDIYGGAMTVDPGQFGTLVKFFVQVNEAPQSNNAAFISLSGFTEFVQAYDCYRPGEFWVYGGTTVQLDQGFTLSGGNFRCVGNGVGTLALGGQGFLANQGVVYIGASQPFNEQDSPTLSVQGLEGAPASFDILDHANLIMGVYYSINGPHYSVLQCLIPMVLDAPNGAFSIISVFDDFVSPEEGQEFIMIQTPNGQPFFSFGAYGLNWQSDTEAGAYGYQVDLNDVTFLPGIP